MAEIIAQIIHQDLFCFKAPSFGAAACINIGELFIPIFTGILPALLWLWYWLREDPHPEPRKTLIFSFILGMLGVPVALFLEYFLYELVKGLDFSPQTAISMTSPLLLLGWAFIEEIVKFQFAWWGDLKRSVYDEPVDALIYLITVALGFAALENVFFLFDLYNETPTIMALTANLRFFGANLLHIVSSATIGVSIAFSFFHKEHAIRNIWGGIILATLLHWAFNAAIINAAQKIALLETLSVVWTFAIILIFIFEKVKKIDPAS
ncbi:TPA: hypothetical protein DCZ50_03135 [Candidatus Nomurabacteria bacterium]|uniref:Protease PrsW n=1 Tax=Candidatus Giovannonibacteria bacterium GW2011_GWF2_42_19 TaxID=1618659 RepID=A0A0G1BHS0_9BACT|nr:MAG: hypothetical protein UV11_C0039G0025 [Candidatus Giovannonibacteria bacterium GW2011_GWF2_42_19]HBB49852.1 hypothetical protein [Candidatus Nomurabacteria bacterium]